MHNIQIKEYKILIKLHYRYATISFLVHVLLDAIYILVHIFTLQCYSTCSAPSSTYPIYIIVYYNVPS